MAKVWVYAELNQGELAPISNELLAKARDLGDAEAVALGPGAAQAAATLGKHGAKTVFVNEDHGFADTLKALVKQHSPDLLLFGFTSDSREVAGRLAARLGTGCISNALDVKAQDGGFVARVPYFGGAKVADYKANAKPAIVLLRPKSVEASEVGGEAKVEQVPATIGEKSKRARVLERKVEAAEAIKLEDAGVIISGGRGLGGPENGRASCRERV